MHTGEFIKNCWSLDSEVWFTPWSLTPWWDVHRGAWLRGMRYTTELDSAPQYDAHCGAFKKFEYLGEIETEFENTLACLSGAYMGLNHEKKLRSKSSWHTPFNALTFLHFPNYLQRYHFNHYFVLPMLVSTNLSPLGHVVAIFPKSDGVVKLFIKK